MNNSRARGRYFPVNYDLINIQKDIAQEQEATGTTVLWWTYDPVNSVDSSYDEGGRRWTGPLTIPVLSADRREGALQGATEGEYYIDTLTLRLSYEQSRLAGLAPEISQKTGVHLADRVGYDGRIFNIIDINVEGQFNPEGVDVIVQVTATQARADELVNDIDFAVYSA